MNEEIDNTQFILIDTPTPQKKFSWINPSQEDIAPRKTYPQQWKSYNQCQTSEKLLTLEILDSLVNSLHIRTLHKNTGRPPFEAGNMLKCCMIKVYNNFSSRRTVGELRLAKSLGIIEKVPHFNSIGLYLNNSSLTPYLKEIIERLAKLVAPYEESVAIDSTGISTMYKERWVQVRLEHKKHKDYKKLHISCGVKTHVITSIKITEGTVSDTPQLKGLLNEIPRNFCIKQVSADAGYLSRENAEAIEKIGATPYILPKKNTRIRTRGSPAWGRMVRAYTHKNEEFMQHYHQRSNVETVFSMIKKKIGGYVRSKKDTAQENEILCKVIIHNISVIIKAMYELGINLENEQ